MIAETSREAYRSLKDLSGDQRVAHSQIQYMEQQATSELNLPSRRDVAYSLGWETSRVAARVNDLIRYGFVVEKGKKIDRITGKRVSTLATTNPSEKKYGAAVSWLHDDE